MARRTSRRPVRVGLTPTSRITIALPGVIAAAVMKKAAAEKSPTTATGLGRSVAPLRLTERLIPLDVGAQVAQKALGVVARAAIAVDAYCHAAKDSSKEQRRFYLRRRGEQNKAAGLDLRCAVQSERQAPLRGIDLCAERA